MFKVEELLKATKGRLIGGRGNHIEAVKGVSIDSRTIKKNEAFIAIKGRNFNGHDFINEAIGRGASCIIKEANNGPTKTKGPGIIEVKDTLKALGDIALFKRRQIGVPVIAVTGSNGKTTTKEMIAWLLSGRYKVLKNEGTKNNQIGLPLTLLNLQRRYDAVILELGTNHFGEIGYLARICEPNIGIITNIGQSHLEYLRNLGGVLREKYTLIDNLEEPRIAVLNTDDECLRRKISRRTSGPFILGFGIRNRGDFSASDIKYLSGRMEFSINQKYKFTLKTLGYYNIYNALAAVAVARLFGMGYEDIASRLKNFNFPQSRLNFIKLNSVRFIDDTYNSNPSSLRQALEVLASLKSKGRKIFIMGDMLELGNREKAFHSRAGQDVAKICDAFIAVGSLSKLAADAAVSCGLDVKNIFTCESSTEARNILFNKIFPKGADIVLVKGSRAMKMEEVFKF